MISNLALYENKNIRLVTIDDEVFIGFVGDYIDPIDDENGEESLVLDITDASNPIEFKSNEIKSIEII